MEVQPSLPIGDGPLFDTKPVEHREIREGDEFVCRRCRKRWDTNEDAPDCCA